MGKWESWWDETMRCFLAIELPTEIRNQLALLQKRFAELGRAVRWTQPEQIHLTLKFLGEVADDNLPDVCGEAVKIAAAYDQFELALRGTGCFPPRGGVRIIWVAVAEPPQALLDCQRTCEEEYAKLGFKKENRIFSPHLTIGRVRDFGASERIRAAVQNESEFNAGSFIVDELVLFQSVLKPSGPVYTVISRAALGGSA